jgi:hypothetical protein
LGFAVPDEVYPFFNGCGILELTENCREIIAGIFFRCVYFQVYFRLFFPSFSDSLVALTFTYYLGVARLENRDANSLLLPPWGVISAGSLCW